MTLENIDRPTTNIPTRPAHPAPWPTEALLFTQIPLEEARKLQEEALQKLLAGGDETGRHQMLITEHPPTFLLGDDVSEADEAAIKDEFGAQESPPVFRSSQARGVEVFGPGQLAVYLTMDLEHWRRDIDGLVTALEDVLLRVLADFGVAGERQGDGRAIRVPAQGNRPIATLRTRLRRWVATARVTLHTNTDLEPLQTIHAKLGGSGRADNDYDDEHEHEHENMGLPVTMVQLGMPIERQDAVREAFLHHYEAVLGSRVAIAQREELRTAKPPWLKARLPHALGTERVSEIIGGQRLHTVCESAHCPNMGECWGHGTATFMINGNICTRSCSFCAVYTGRPQALDRDEPRRVAEAARLMGLQYVVVTSVNRDELSDGGASNFAQTIRLLREQIPGVAIEVLIPDFRGVAAALEAVFATRPDVLNHNIETVERLYRRVRPQARYARSLEVIVQARAAGLTTKSGIMLGLGEEEEEIERTLRDLHAHGCSIVTIGQYLRPSEKHHPLVRYATPAEFERWRERGLAIGFQTVESGPLVRSSYHAHLSYRRHTHGNG